MEKVLLTTLRVAKKRRASQKKALLRNTKGQFRFNIVGSKLLGSDIGNINIYNNENHGLELCIREEQGVKVGIFKQDNTYRFSSQSLYEHIKGNKTYIISPTEDPKIFHLIDTEKWITKESIAK